MIEGISAVTLGTHEMPRAVRFYCALGFEVLRGNGASSRVLRIADLDERISVENAAVMALAKKRNLVN